MNIRKATKADIIQASVLWALLINEVFKGRKPDIAYWQRFISDLMDNDSTYTMYVAEEGDKLVGFTDFIIQYDPSFSKRMLNSFQTYVLPPYRKTGITKALWGNVFRTAREEGCDMVFFATDPGKYTYWKDLMDAELSEIFMVVKTPELKEV